MARKLSVAEHRRAGIRLFFWAALALAGIAGGVLLGEMAVGTRLGDGPVALDLGAPVPVAEISTGPRVGLRLAPERPWRFWITGDPTVSRYVAAKPRSPRKH